MVLSFSQTVDSGRGTGNGCGVRWVRKPRSPALPGNGASAHRLMSCLSEETMKFRALFVANGSVVIDADSQEEAEEKADELSVEQVAKAIDSVKILDVVEEGKKLPAPDR